jgi:hypothetical protein
MVLWFDGLVHRTWTLLAKLLPLTVSAKAGPVTTAEGGFSEVTTGVPGSIINPTVLEVRTPQDSEAALVTLISTVPLADRRARLILTVICVAVVVSGVSVAMLPESGDHCTWSPGRKLEPFIVNSNSGPPAGEDAGFKGDVIAGVAAKAPEHTVPFSIAIVEGALVVVPPAMVDPL